MKKTFSSTVHRIKLGLKHPIFLLWLCISIVRFFPSFLFGKTLFFGDNYSLLIPGKIFTAQWLKHGILPLWNPTILSGISWIGDISQSILYPSTLLFIIFHPGIALTLTIAIHLLIAMVGMYLLSLQFVKNTHAALFASILWTLSTQMTGNMNNLATIQSLAWAPLVMVSALMMLRNRKWSVAFILSASLQIYAGYPQYAFFTVLCSGIFAAFFMIKEKHAWIDGMKKYALTFALILLLTAPVLLPFIETLRGSTRMQQNTAQALTGSADPINIAKVFVPYLFDKPSDGIKWGPSWNGFPNVMFYVTWIGLVFAGIAVVGAKERKTTLFLCVVGGIFFLSSMGEYFPLYTKMLAAFPLSKLMRSSSQIMFITNITFILLSSMGFEYVMKKIKIQRIVVFLSILLSVILFSFYMLSSNNFMHVWNTVDQIAHQKLSRSSFHTIERDRKIYSMIMDDILLLFLFFTISLILLRKKKYTLFLACIVIDMVYHTNGLVFWAPDRIMDTPSVSFNELHNPQYRTLTRNMNTKYSDYVSYWEALMVRAPFSDSFVDSQELKEFSTLNSLKLGLTPNWNMVTNTNMLLGYVTLLPSDYSSIWNRDDVTNINSLDRIDPLNEKVREWGVRYYLVDNNFNTDAIVPGEIIGVKDNLLLFELDALPRFRYSDEEEIEIQNYQETPNEISFSFKNTGKDLIVANRYDANWRAYINGKQTEIYESNGMQKIAISQSDEMISLRLVYFPALFYIGCMLGIVGVIACIYLGHHFKVSAE